jgi:hypothetical protein
LHPARFLSDPKAQRALLEVPFALTEVFFFLGRRVGPRALCYWSARRAGTGTTAAFEMEPVA